MLTLQILKVFNAHVLLKTKMFKQSKHSWFQKDVKLAIKIRNNLYRQSEPSTSNWEFFKIARNNVHTITKKAKCIYCQTQFGNEISNKDFWKIFARLVL